MWNVSLRICLGRLNLSVHAQDKRALLVADIMKDFHSHSGGFFISSFYFIVTNTMGKVSALILNLPHHNPSDRMEEVRKQAAQICLKTFWENDMDKNLSFRELCSTPLAFYNNIWAYYCCLLMEEQRQFKSFTGESSSPMLK